jgi:hypothetical protein
MIQNTNEHWLRCHGTLFMRMPYGPVMVRDRLVCYLPDPPPLPQEPTP